MTRFADRVSDYPVDAQFIERWSPRSFTGEPIPHETLLSLFEAARWAPSSNNSQPWRFVYGLQGTPAFGRILNLLVPSNQAWAKAAGALVVVASKMTVAIRGQERPSHSHSFDTGAAWQNISLQALKLGWHTHAMVGFDMPRAALELGVPDGCRVEAAIAIGKQADRSVLPAEAQEREKPNGRRPVSSFAFEGAFKNCPDLA
jgi:nitroreductase